MPPVVSTVAVLVTLSARNDVPLSPPQGLSTTAGVPPPPHTLFMQSSVFDKAIRDHAAHEKLSEVSSVADRCGCCAAAAVRSVVDGRRDNDDSPRLVLIRGEFFCFIIVIFF
jgi:bacterioferritin-associated ferredoxin